MKYYLAALIAVLLLASCGRNKPEHIERAFYYWKSDSYEISDAEDTILRQENIKKLYIKFFEVTHDELLGNIPIAKTGLSAYSGDSLERFEVVPVVFIANEVFLKSSRPEVDTLVSNTASLLSKYYKSKIGINPPREIQIDCDWTPKSRDSYFYFLKQLKKQAGASLSCTLRLYPYKYRDKMGIPPVDKAMLMCYNLSNPLKSGTKNSILDVAELHAYVDGVDKYPLHLDVALPVFSWIQVYQNRRFRGLIYPKEDMMGLLKEVKPLWYEVKVDTLINDRYLRKGDMIKYEQITADVLNRAISEIKDNVDLDDSLTISLFHLDENQLKFYTHEELNGFYSAFSQ